MSTSIGRLPLGVAIIAVLVGIFGFFILLLGLLIALLGIGFGLAGSSTVFGLGGLIGGLIVLIIGAIWQAVADMDLWNRGLWALVLAILVLLFYGAVEFVSQSWVGFVIVAILLVYLVAVSSHFD